MARAVRGSVTSLLQPASARSVFQLYWYWPLDRLGVVSPPTVPIP